MTFGKALALTGGFAGAMALGVWMGPYITQRHVDVQVPASAEVQPAPLELTSPPMAPRKAAVVRTTVFAPTGVRVDVSSPELHQRLKPILKAGADVAVASNGFGSAEEFAATAHASRNVDVPFMLLKHRIVEQKKSLARAIEESRPDVNATVQADLARAEARADLISIGL